MQEHWYFLKNLHKYAASFHTIHISKSTGILHMNLLVSISNMIIPLVIFYIIAMGILNKQDVYSEFIEGAEDGF